jgi:hypothetical protein
MTKATLFRTATIAALTVMIGGAQPAQTAEPAACLAPSACTSDLVVH